MKPGDRVYISGKTHPWKGQAGTLEALTDFGPPSLKMNGWRVKLDNGMSCFAKPLEITKIK